ncbi:proline--tRNA ligase [Paenibacillus koleovorans]|uniref:proline--tRNA ligase n=1 Tax=Paenibacillus koleovorans TaxID=121608 RepID=UPI000FDBE32B|nr:proline--tRNA ligase [Paenibacillus koleovorans]
MRQQHLLLPTLREAPTEAEAMSHQLLLRAGYIRQVAAGVYTYLPLGQRVLQRLAAIVRSELDRAGAQELLMPALQPAELWQQSGRYELYGPELVRLQDRHGREFALGPTHEEVITSLVGSEVSSYRQLPLTLYQIQTKFRDERRPRFGLLRGREFLMKDAYSFDLDLEGLDRSYRSMFDAYVRILDRCGLNYRAVEADPGTIGGEGGTHEFMVLADIGEDTIVSCTNCGYSANMEKAEFAAARKVDARDSDSSGGCEDSVSSIAAMEKFHTPGIKTIEELAVFTGAAASDCIKTLLYVADGRLVAVLVRGDHEVNEIKVREALGAQKLELADEAAARNLAGVSFGFIGPVGLNVPLLLVDRDAANMPEAIVGANEDDYHMRHVVPGRDFAPTLVGEYRNAAAGDTCPHCSALLQFHRGIEVGHVFKLGTRYSEKLGATVLDRAGQTRTLVMGCYGIGVSRLLSAIVEQHHDPNGIAWPAAVAPFQVHLIQVSLKDEQQTALAESLYRQLREAGIDVLLDDRDERPGVKFKDADLIGIPIRVTVGKHAAEGLVEVKTRFGSADAVVMTVDELLLKTKGVREQ